MTEFGTSVENGQGLIYEDSLPMQWRASDSETSVLDRAKLDGKNEEVLRFIEVLDEHPNESSSEHSSLNQELLKVEIKFDLLLSLVNQLLGVYFPLPTPVRVRLTPDGIQWISDATITPDSQGLVEIYLSNRCPRPLVFPSRVKHSEKDGQRYRITAQFTDMGEPIRERLEKMIFRHHRRMVAMIRRKHSPDSQVPSS